MTPSEYQRILEAMTPEQFAQFNVDFGGGELSIRHRVQEFANDQAKFEPELCRLLNVSTESEKRSQREEVATQAAREAAASSTKGNEIAADSNVIAKRALYVAVGAFLVSIASLLVAFFR